LIASTAAGISIDGGASALNEVVVIQDHDFSTGGLQNVERLSFLPPQPVSVTIGGTVGLNRVQSNPADSHLTVTGSLSDLTDVKFLTWSAADTITLQGTTGADKLSGAAGTDTREGGAGADTLIGNTGQDIVGGSQADRVVFQKPGDSPTTAPDTIGDFQSGLDRIVLTGIDPDTSTAATDDSFTFLGSAAFTHQAGHAQPGSGGEYSLAAGGCEPRRHCRFLHPGGRQHHPPQHRYPPLTPHHN